MKKQTIGVKELFAMIVLFELGSALLFSLGADAKQDAWLAVLAGLIAGILIAGFYLYLYRYSNQQTLTVFLKTAFGKYAGWILGFFYIIYFIYIASRIFRDFITLITMVAYEDTSYLTIAIPITLCVMYAAYKGIEVFSRFSMIIFYIVMTFLLLIFILEMASGLTEFKNLQPVMENGPLPVLKAAYPMLETFPYGELIVFLMIFPYVKKSEKMTKPVLKAVLIGGMILLIFTFMNLLILGADVYSRSSFPLLTTVSYINIGEFIQRLESMVLIIMVLLGFVKIHLFSYAAILGSSDLFNIPKNKLIYPVTLLILISSIMIASNNSEHLKEGLKTVPFLVHFPFRSTSLSHCLRQPGCGRRCPLRSPADLSIEVKNKRKKVNQQENIIFTGRHLQKHFLGYNQFSQ
ncbi:GerAB/ArcD/ProY family transporter [Bacillus salacetis]|uniref:GerAB/ArcD/ProY family transporter n=1 Tax=Bacillus salacetis TaxID=2315464 RepID=UPI003BA2AF05